MDLVVPLDELVPIERYRVHQLDDGSVQVSVVPHEAITAEALERIRAGYASVLGPGMPVSIEVVDDIPRTAAGKYPMVTSARTRSDVAP
jgi:hypothetical protein